MFGKKAIKFMALGMVLAMLTGVCGCSGNKDSDNQNETEQVTEDITPQDDTYEQKENPEGESEEPGSETESDDEHELTEEEKEKIDEEIAGQADQKEFEAPIKKLVDGMNERDVEKFLESYHPVMRDAVKTVITKEYLDILVNEEYGNSNNISYKVTKEEEITDEALTTLAENYNKSAKEAAEDTDVNYDAVAIQKAYKVDVTFEWDEESRDTSTNVGQIDGEWYILGNF